MGARGEIASRETVSVAARGGERGALFAQYRFASVVEFGRVVAHGSVCFFKMGHATLALPASCEPPCLVHNTTSTPSLHDE